MSRPKEILIDAINKFLLERLEDEGFKFNEKSAKFVTKPNEANFKFEINFLGSKTNWLDEFVSFQVQYLVYAPKYKSWAKKNFPNQTLLGGGYVYGENKILYERTTINHYGFGYDFVRFNAEDIMNEIWGNYVNHGKRYFESASNWEKINEHANTASSLVDSLIFQEKKEDALTFVQSTLDRFAEKYGGEENIPITLKQSVNIYKSRVNYLQQL